MAIVTDVQCVMDWLAEEVCPRVELKLPPEDWRDVDAADYAYQLVHPAVHGMYWPTGPQMVAPPYLFQHPGILVQVTDGEDSVAERTQTMTVRMHLSAWNPGLHGRDVWVPSDGPGGGYVRREADEFAPSYDDGWRDAWSFVDVLVRELRNASDVGGLSVDRSRPVRFGPYSEQGSIPDLYPFWFAWVEVALYRGQASPNFLQDYL